MSEEFIRVAATDDIEPGKGIKVTVGTKNVALFNVGGDYYAVQNNCPHKGAPLFCGDVDTDNNKIACLDHGWNFSLIDGKSTQGPECDLMCWDVKIEGKDILLSKLPRL